jgi:hypothetical protein
MTQNNIFKNKGTALNVKFDFFYFCITMIFKIIIVSIVLLAIAFTAMSINILIKKNGKFPKSQIGHNKKMREKGIECAFTQDYKSQKQVKGWNRPN